MMLPMLSHVVSIRFLFARDVLISIMVLYLKVNKNA